jgi:hypothetical protein
LLPYSFPHRPAFLIAAFERPLAGVRNPDTSDLNLSVSRRGRQAYNGELVIEQVRSKAGTPHTVIGEDPTAVSTLVSVAFVIASASANGVAAPTLGTRRRLTGSAFAWTLAFSVFLASASVYPKRIPCLDMQRRFDTQGSLRRKQ